MYSIQVMKKFNLNKKIFVKKLGIVRLNILIHITRSNNIYVGYYNFYWCIIP